MAGGVGQARPPLIDERELNFIILHYLRNGPSREAAKVLEQQLTQQGLLPRRVDFEGEEHNGTYHELVARHRRLDPSHLRLLLEQLVHSSQAAPLSDASCPSLLSLSTHGIRGSQAARPCPTSRMKALMHRETGSRRDQRASSLHKQSASFQIPKLSLMTAVRGHHIEVYCVVWDRRSNRFATGSDDKLVKIWCAQTGLLLSTCRGHDGEVTDFAVSICNTFVASSSNDASVRVWHFNGPKTGHPQCVLLGHGAPVSYLDFHPKMPHALLSSSFDGTCRIWNVMDPDSPAIVLHPVQSGFGPHRLLAAAQAGGHPMPASYWTGSRQQQARLEHEEAAAAERARTAEGAANIGADNAGDGLPGAMALLCCSFSVCGTFIVAGGTDCNSYLWHWNTSMQLPVLGDASSSKATTALSVHPLPVELVKLTGHRNDISVVAFSTSGHAIASASKDGNVLVWKRAHTKSGRAPRFDMSMCLKCDIDSQQNGGNRQARRRTSVPAVNQAVWSKDDQRLVAALSDHTLRVFDASSRPAGSAADLASGKGRLLFILRGHHEQVHVLSAHPCSPNVVMSAGYDGRVCLWDVIKGVHLKTFEADHRGGTDRDPVPVLDGHFSPDGHSIVVTDVAGQATIYNTGSPHRYRLTQYDQFLATDYAHLLRDSRGNVLDADSQVPPHLMPPQQLVNMSSTPYPEPYQSAYRDGNLEAAAADGLLEGQPSSGWSVLDGRRWLLHTTSPPVLMAAFWHASTQGLTDRAISRRVQEAEERYTSSHQQAQFIEAGLIPASARSGGQPGRTTGAPAASVSRVGAMGFGTAGSPLGPRPSPVQRPAERLTPQAGRRPPQNQGRPRPRARGPSARAVQQQLEEEEEEEEREWVVGSSSEEEEDVSVVEEECSSSDDEERRRRNRQARNRAGTTAAARAQAGASSSRAAAAEPTESSRGRQIKRRRHADEEDGGASEEEGKRRRNGKRPRNQSDKEHKQKKNKSKQKDKSKGKEKVKAKEEAEAEDAEAPDTPRELECYSWLQGNEPRVPTRQYVPQQGDMVVYLKELHKSHLESMQDKLTRAAWQQLKCRYSELRQAEKCRLLSLEYFVVPGTLETGVKCCLALVNSPTFGGRTFVVELLPSQANPTDFVIPAERFEKATARPWRAGDICQIWFEDEGLWRAEVVEDVGYETARDRGTLKEELLPWDGLPLCQRFKVAWEVKEEDAGGSSSGVFDYSMPDLVHPWEMLEDGRTAEELLDEIPQLDETVAQRMHPVVRQFMEDEAYGVYVHQEAPDAVYGGVAYNAVVELPIGLADIDARLDSGYYRSTDAVLSDLNLMNANCIAFNGVDEYISELCTYMVEQLTGTLLGTLPPGDENGAGPSTPAAEEEAEEAEPAAPPSTASEPAEPEPIGRSGGRSMRMLRVRLRMGAAS